MRQTLFRIPLDADWSLGPLGEVPGFGFGLALAVWGLLCLFWAYSHYRATGRRVPDISLLILWCVVGLVIVKAPQWLHRATNQSIAQANAVLQQDPGSTAAYRQRAEARFSKREYTAAIRDLERVLELAPEDREAGLRLAWLLATVPDPSARDGQRAKNLVQQFCDLDQQPVAARCLDVAAAAQAELGDFPQAVKLQQQALVIADRSGDPVVHGMVPAMRERLASYTAAQPHRDRTAGKWIPVFGYGFMLFLGFLFGGWAAASRIRQIGLSPDLVWDLAMWIFLSGIIGARLFYVIQYHDRVFFMTDQGRRVLKEPFDLLHALVNLPDGGLVLYGGVLLGAVMYFVFCRRRRVDPLVLADTCVPSVFIGLAFGRLGCFLNGCCYGDRCELPWQMRFPLGSVPDSVLVERGFLLPDALASLPLHPTQLYSSFNAAVLALLTHYLFRSGQPKGTVTVVALLLYPFSRIVMELLRGDEMGKFGTGLTISQFVSLGVFLLGVALWIYLRGQRKWQPNVPG